MRDLISALIGVPASIAIAGGLGLAAVTIYLRLRPRPGQPPVRWAHLLLGVALFGIGVALLGLDVSIVGLT